MIMCDDCAALSEKLSFSCGRKTPLRASEAPVIIIISIQYIIAAVFVFFIIFVLFNAMLAASRLLISSDAMH